MTAQAIINTYQYTGTIRKTAELLCLSQQSVRRTLISAGVYEGERSQRVAEYVRAGKTMVEIAAEIGVKPKTVRTHLPYSRGPYYIDDKTTNARRIAAWRAGRGHEKALDKAGEQR